MTDHPPLHHFFHCFASGDWAQPVTEHFEALTRYGLLNDLATIHVGYVGTPDQIAAARCTVEHYAPTIDTVAESPSGWEQETLDPLYRFVQDHDGLVSYAHTKGASRRNPIDTPWRRMMTYHCFVDWQHPVAALEQGKAIAGCYWLRGSTPLGSRVRWRNGVPVVTEPQPGGIFGGNFWWTHAELLRRNVPPDGSSRHAAEHWLGQLSDEITLDDEAICNMRSFPIGESPPDWWS